VGPLAADSLRENAGEGEGIVSKRYRDKRRLGPFVPLLKETLESAAWRSISPSARVLYIALKGRYGIILRNNGRIFLSVRESAEETGLNKDTIARAFRELTHYGFIVQTKGGCLGVDGKGKAPHWRLTELGYMTDPPTKDFLRWNGTKFRKPKNKTPSENFGHTVRRYRTPLSENLGQSDREVSENFGHTADPACPEISDISRLTTSPHKKGTIPAEIAAVNEAGRQP
jgi:hypothetical protein